MDLIVFIAVLAAAVLHASWNAMVKHGSDKFVSMSAIVAGHVLFGTGALVVFPTPDMASLPYIFAGAILHTGYQLFLLNSYRVGDLSQVYPVARGSAPLIVTFVSVVFLGVHLNGGQISGVMMIALGIISLVVVRRGQGLVNRNAGLLALATGCFIAAYSLNDGLGARISGSPIGFYAWVTILNGAMYMLIMARVRPAVFAGLAGPARRLVVIGGGGSFLAYGLVTWAFTLAPIALVTALRETSIIFAMFIGVLFLKERLDLARLVSVMVSMGGAILLRLSR